MGWQFSTQLIHRLDYMDRCSQMLNSLICHVSPENQSSLENLTYLQNEHFHLAFLIFSCKSTTFNQLNKPTREHSDHYHHLYHEGSREHTLE